MSVPADYSRPRSPQSVAANGNGDSRTQTMIIMEEGGGPAAIQQRWQCSTLPLHASAVFLAPVIIVSGMTAVQGDKWKLMFIGLFTIWLLLLALGLYLDLRVLERTRLVKRSLWHLCCSILLLYLFVSMLHLSSDNLPQWIPLAVNAGLGASACIQDINSETRQRLGEYVRTFLGSIFGTQILMPRAGDPLLPRNVPPPRHAPPV